MTAREASQASEATVSKLSREERLAAVHERLQAAVEGLTTGDDWIRAIEFASRFRRRSFQNSMLIMVQHLAAFEEGHVDAEWPSYVAGFRQWQALGRQVDKGQAGYMIYAPVTARDVVDANGTFLRRLGRGERPGPGEATKTRVIGVKPTYVWDVSQTSGTSLPVRPMPRVLDGQAPVGLQDGLIKLLNGRNFSVTTVPSAADLGGSNGLTNFGDRTVRYRIDMSEAGQVKTLAHEAGHVLMHDPSSPDVPAHRGRVEVEAETVALLVVSAHGMSSMDYTLPYVAGWANTVSGRTPTEVITETGSRCVTAANTILDQLTTIQGPDGDPPGLEVIRETSRGRYRQRSRRPSQAVAPSQAVGL